MIKTVAGNRILLVEQPDHARVSGYLAAHWGGANGFAAPGHYPSASHPARWRDEVVLAVAQHDNGWWEWEATPPIDPLDGLPLGLGDVAKHGAEDGLNRWRSGVPRLADQHPYAALLISRHAFWLYAFSFDDLTDDDDAPCRHPLFAAPDQVSRFAPDATLTRRFLDEQRALQGDLIQRCRSDAIFEHAVEPLHVRPHVKLLQLFDALSLLLAFGGTRPHTLADIPRRGWDDRVTLQWRPQSDQGITVTPWPFDADPLVVHMPMRSVPASAPAEQPGPLTRLHGTPLHTRRFELRSGG